MIAELDINQKMALRLFKLVTRRLPTDQDMAAIIESGRDFPTFRLTFLMEWLGTGAKDRLMRRYKDFLLSGLATEKNQSRLTHNFEVARLSLEELQNKIDGLSSVSLELMRHAERINSVLAECGNLQRQIQELSERLKRDQLHISQTEAAPARATSIFDEVTKR